MATAVVTGSNGTIAKTVSQKLLKLGYDVIGISRYKNEIDNPHFKNIICDLSKQEKIEKILFILQNDNSISILCNIAGFGVFKPHEDIKIPIIIQMITLNLSTPIILSNILLKTLKQNSGIIFNITSTEALRSSKFSALYSATKSGLRAFSLALFEEVRKQNAKVVSINPDMTNSSFFNELNFKPTDKFNTALHAKDIADVVETTLNTRDGVAITIRAQKFAITKKSYK